MLHCVAALCFTPVHSLLEIVLVLVRFDHVVYFAVNVDHSIM
jgi:hypothetical protein